jgi:hypothetical protein
MDMNTSGMLQPRAENLPVEKAKEIMRGIFRSYTGMNGTHHGN